jgi:hypothetical protein
MTDSLCEFADNGVCVRCGYTGTVSGLLRHCVISTQNGQTGKPVDAPTLAELSYGGDVLNADLLPSPAVAFGVPSGPGTELSKLLKRFGIEPTPTCACRAKQQEMDAWGCDEASKPERIDEVVAVMRAEAEARGLPFLGVAGRMLVRRAIANARRKA